MSGRVYSADITVTPVVADVAITARFYVGFAMQNTNQATTATVNIYDGTSTAGTLIDTVTMLPNESVREWYPDSISLRTGSIFVDTAAGVLVGIRLVK